MPGPGKLLYDLFLAVYRLAARISSYFDPKAKQWLTGQREVQEQLRSLSIPGKTIWVHCASLGEYEQARPVIDCLKKDHSDYHLVLTFFSPSGYKVVSKRENEATVLYLPFDSAANARLFLEAIHPSLAIFIKYEHWYYYLVTLKTLGIPALSVSAVFRPSQVFFKWYGRFFRNMLRLYKKILVQDSDSLKLLKTIGINPVEVSGDTRFDRVLAIKAVDRALIVIEKFAQDGQLIVTGSTWPPDEELLIRFIHEQGSSFPFARWAIVPHEPGSQHIQQLVERLKVPAILYSNINEQAALSAKVIVVDVIGVLARMYRYASIAYIGGGFGVGIHNTLEAAAYGIPVVFGPHYTKFREAREMVALGAAYSIKDYAGLVEILNTLLINKPLAAETGKKAGKYVVEHAGATDKVMEVIKETLSNTSEWSNDLS